MYGIFVWAAPEDSDILLYFFFCLFYLFVFCCGGAAPTAYGSSQARGWIGVAAAGLSHSHSNKGSQPHLRPTPQLNGNTESLTHWVGPGIEPTASWILVGFITTEPQQELQTSSFPTEDWITPSHVCTPRDEAFWSCLKSIPTPSN